MENHKVVSKEEWLAARIEHLASEKEFTRLRDQLSRQRRELPWVKVDKEYVFDGPNGKETLSELFAGRSQLLINHFMFDPSWDEGCVSCSFWADNYNGIIVHLNHRDVTMVTVSRAPLDQLEAYRRRMEWSFKWVSSCETDFNRDYHVSFTAEDLDKGEAYYNYDGKAFSRVLSTGQRAWRMRLRSESEGAGISVFYKDKSGNVFHTYSCYARGLDMLNGAYHFLDLLPKGRDEAGLPHPMAWVCRHDKYND